MRAFNQKGYSLTSRMHALDAGVEAAVILASFKADLELAKSRLAASENRLGRLSLRAPLSALQRGAERARDWLWADEGPGRRRGFRKVARLRE